MLLFHRFGKALFDLAPTVVSSQFTLEVIAWWFHCCLYTSNQNTCCDSSPYLCGCFAFFFGQLISFRFREIGRKRTHVLCSRPKLYLSLFSNSDDFALANVGIET